MKDYSPRYDLMSEDDYERYIKALDKDRLKTYKDKKLISKWKEEATRAFYYHKYNKNND